MNMTDVLILIILAITVFLGYRKNLFRNFFDFFSLMGAFFISLRFYGTFASKIVEFPGIKQFIALIKEVIVSKLERLDSETAFTLEGLKELDLSDSFNFFFEQGSFFREKAELNFSELSLGLVSNVLSLILLFVVTLIVFRLLGSLLERVHKMAGLTLVDRFGGVLFSFLKGMIYAAIIAVIVNNISALFNSGLLYDLYHGSKFSIFFFESGLLDSIFR